MTCKTILLLFFLVSPSFAYFKFRSRIPNGEHIPHPCKANYMWGGVGHLDPNGGGERNAFGRDFYNAGYRWTDELCRFDSDGDGMTNGQELGDPDCKWNEGIVPDRVTDISHPGICTPYGQGVCVGRDTFVDCTIKTFGESCDVIKDPNVQSIDLRFQTHTIPNTETNYYCQYFDMPTDQDYHIVANEGLIDNRNIVHHMIVYGCPDSYNSSPKDNSPNPCNMGENAESCSTPISLWTVGLPGSCFGRDLGFRIGMTGYKKVKLEIHYNNPLLVSDYIDNSGFRLHYRNAQPTVQDLTTFAIGQSVLEIPPGKYNVDFKGDCPSDCTKALMVKPMYVFSTLNHMHYLGRSQKTQIIRNGQVVKVLADDHHYNYDSPKVYKLEEPFEVLPGDEIVTTCSYSSMSRKQYVYFGEGTTDEMCFAFLTIYPANAIPYTTWCSSYGPLSPCDFFARTPKHGCDWARFSNLSNPEMAEHYMNLLAHCKLDGKCRPECHTLVKEMKQHPCLQEEMNFIVTRMLQRYHEGTSFLGRLHSCSGYEEGKQDCKEECEERCNGPLDAGLSLSSQIATVVMMILFAMVMIYYPTV